MADGFSSFYYGNMAAPIRLPNGTLVAAPTYSRPTSIDEIYRGILAPPSAAAMDTIGPGTRPGGSYLQLSDMVDAMPQPDRLRPSSPNVDLPGMGGVNPVVLAY